MTRDDIIRMAREAGLVDYCDLEGDSVGLLALVTLCQDVAAAEREPLLEALTAICVKCRSNEWGPDTPRKEILNWMHDHANEAIFKAQEQA